MNIPLTVALLVKDIQDSHVIRVILDVNFPPNIVTKFIRAVFIAPLGNAYIADKHIVSVKLIVRNYFR